MLTKKRYSVKDMLLWTRRETLLYLIFMLVVTTLYDVFDLTFLHVPWTPVALIGTAVAFIIGFQNSAAYGRIWEARKIWGGIPFCTAVAWVFQTMERIGRVGENPFEGTANDVPISTIARGIEIDIRQMMNEDQETIPKQFPEEYNVQM